MTTRADLLAAVHARLEAQKAWDKRDPPGNTVSPVLREESLTEAQRLRQTLTGTEDDLDAYHALAWLHLRRFAALPEDAGQDAWDEAIDMFTVCFLADAVDVAGLPEGLLSEIAWEASQRAGAMLQQAVGSFDPEPFDDLIVLWQRILAATPDDDSNWPYCSGNLGLALQNRFNRCGNRADLDAAITAHQAAAAVIPAEDPNRPLMLTDLGCALQSRYTTAGDPADVDGAIAAHRAAAAAGPAPRCLANLGLALRYRYEQAGSPNDLDAAVSASQAAVDSASLDDPDRAGMLSNLGAALRLRFDRAGAPADRDGAIEALQESLASTPPGHPNVSLRMNNLGLALQTRFGHTGVVADLNAAIDALRAAIDAAPPGHPQRASSLSNLGGALENRFGRLGHTEDLDAAIECLYAAVNALPPDHPTRPAGLNNLALVLHTRFDQTGAFGDLDAAVEVARAAVADTAPGHPDLASRLSSLGSALLFRSVRTGSEADLDAAVEIQRTALAAAPVGHTKRPIFLNCLALALLARFRRAGSLADLHTTIDACRSALDVLPPDHPLWISCRVNLGIALETLFGKEGDSGDLDAAIDAYDAVLVAIPSDHPDRPKQLLNLGTALRMRFDHAGVAADRATARSLLTEAAETSWAPASTRIRAARVAAGLLAGSDPPHAADLLETAVALLPEVAPRALDRTDQQDLIKEFAGLAGDAAAVVLNAGGGAERALRLLETGRAVLLGQALAVRSDLTDLRQREPVLADRFVELRDQLDQPSETATLTVEDRRSLNRPRLAAELAATLTEIRALPGFASFALPPPIERLLPLAEPGPVVTYNVSGHRSDALVLTTDGVTALALPELTADTVVAQATAFHEALHRTAHAALSPRDRHAAQQRLGTILDWLWEAAAEPVLAFLGHLTQPPPDGPWPRVWWATGGLLGLLPLHAAGRPGQSVLDRVISSYTPTISALRHARRPRTPHTDRALIVGMAATPGESPLPQVPAEIAALRRQLPNPVVLSEASATKPSVLAELGDATIAHFACHGASDPADPSRSLLLLHDHKQDPLTVASLAPVNMDHARLAYLSACSTAFTSAEGLLDEAIQLTVAFQMAGFPHVIGTLWEIDDRLAATIAVDFYTHLRDESGRLDPGRSAEALHHAIRATHAAHPSAPSLWAAHLHAGA